MALLATGNSGRVYYPALACANGRTFSGYVSKLTTLANADAEMLASERIRQLLPDDAIYPEYKCACQDKDSVQHMDTLLMSKYGGRPLTTYISDYLEGIYYGSRSKQHITIIDLQEHKDILRALYYLRDRIQEMNAAGFFHNDIQQENILYNAATKKAYLIDFERSSTIDLATPRRPDLNDVAQMNDLIQVLKMYITGIEAKFPVQMKQTFIPVQMKAPSTVQMERGGKKSKKKYKHKINSPKRKSQRRPFRFRN